MTMQITSANHRIFGVCMMTLYSIGIIPLSLSKGCSGDESNSNPSRIESQLISLNGADAWLNTEPITAEQLKGKVVLIEFCTYTCINWLRTLPYVRAWSEKYKTKGLVVIGVHTPEFSFERNIDNVKKAVRTIHIEFPVAIDSSRRIWGAFNNQYWPALYIVDGDGRIRHQQCGEGEYEQSEKIIQQLLIESGAKEVSSELVSVTGLGIEAPADMGNLYSQENYLGYERTENFSSRGGGVPGKLHAYRVPSGLRRNQWALSGDWAMEKEAVVLNKAGGRILYRFHARDLHLVMGPAAEHNPVRFRVFIDGRTPGRNHGSDIDENGNGTVTGYHLYQLIRQSEPVADRVVEIEFLDPGVQAFSFTFG
ncbi:MAG: redoxin domain-containing protein [Bacteroidota bacterium]